MDASASPKVPPYLDARKLDIRPHVKLVWLALYARADNSSGKCTVLVKTLSRDTGLSSRAVFRALGELKRLGIIANRRRGERCSEYTVKLIEARSEQRRKLRAEKHVKLAGRIPVGQWHNDGDELSIVEPQGDAKPATTGTLQHATSGTYNSLCTTLPLAVCSASGY